LKIFLIIDLVLTKIFLKYKFTVGGDNIFSGDIPLLNLSFIHIKLNKYMACSQNTHVSWKFYCLSFNGGVFIVNKTVIRRKGINYIKSQWIMFQYNLMKKFLNSFYFT